MGDMLGFNLSLYVISHLGQPSLAILLWAAQWVPAT